MQWTAQPCPPWNPVEATYTDCNGDSIVDIFDINPVIINFGKTHVFNGAALSSNETEISYSLEDPPIFTSVRDYNEITRDFWLDIIVGTTSQLLEDLKVVSLELRYSNTENSIYLYRS